MQKVNVCAQENNHVDFAAASVKRILPLIRATMTIV